MSSYSFIEPSSAIPGIIAISVAGFISLFAVVGLLAYMVYRHLRRSNAEKAGHCSTMGERHMTAYFYSLLVASMLKALSIIMSLRWTYMPMESGAFCTLQSGLKLAGNVGTATWSMVISIHIFNLLFLSLRPIKWSLPAVVGGVWSFVLADVLIGPAAFSDFFGPYDGSDGDGTACWITKKHSTARFLLEYFPTGLTIFSSILLLTATLLHMRGNIVYVNRRIKLRLRLHGDDAWHNEQVRDDLDRNIMATLKRMVWFPVSYFVLWMPVGISRLMQLTGEEQPFGYVAFSFFVYGLTGFVDVLLFVLTRHVVLKDGVVLPAYVDLEKERAKRDGGTAGNGAAALLPPVGEKAPRTAPSGPISLPRPLILQGSIEGAPLSRTNSNSSQSSYKSTSELPTGSTMPAFGTGTSSEESSTSFTLPQGVNLPKLPPLVPVAPPNRMSDVSLIASSVPPETASTVVSGAPSSFGNSSFSAGGSSRRVVARKGVGIGALQNGPKLARNGSAGSQRSIGGSERDSTSSWPTNFMSSGRSSEAASPQTAPGQNARLGAAAAQRSQMLFVPSPATTFEPGTYTAQASILSAYNRETLATPLTVAISDESFVGGAPSAAALSVNLPSQRKQRGGSGETFGEAVRAAGKEVVSPLSADETYKAQLYGTRFSLVAGPVPSYSYDSPKA